MAGLTQVPAIVRDCDDAEAAVLGLIENLCREDLNPVEEARGYQALVDRGLKQTEIAAKVGRDQSTVSNSMRLLRLPEEVLGSVRSGSVSGSGGRALLAYEKYPAIVRALAALLAKGMPVKRLESFSKWDWQIAEAVSKAGAIVSTYQIESGIRDRCADCEDRQHLPNGDMCLKPECLAAKNQQYTERILAKAGGADGVLDLKKVPYDSYKVIEGGGPAGCDPECENRGVGKRSYDDGSLCTICRKPAHYAELEAAEAKRKAAEHRESVAGKVELVGQMLCGEADTMEDLERVYARAEAVGAYNALRDVNKAILEAVGKRLGIELDAELLSTKSGIDKKLAVRKLDHLAGLKRLALVGIVAECLIRKELRDWDPRNSWSRTDVSDWFLGVGDRRDGT
jgi:hypothetical protein